MDALPRKFFAVAFLVAVLLISGSVNASLIYHYDGNNYDEYLPLSPTLYDSTMNVSGEIDFGGLLPSNLDNSLIVPTSFSFNDGLHTVTNINGTGSFTVSTDTSGSITEWLIYIDDNNELNNIGDVSIGIRTVNVIGGNAFDIADKFTCAVQYQELGQEQLTCGVSIQFGRSSDNAGTWTTATTVPIPPALYLFGSGLLGLIGLAKRKKA